MNVGTYLMLYASSKPEGLVLSPVSPMIWIADDGQSSWSAILKK
jgi:hypothetical protein